MTASRKPLSKGMYQPPTPPVNPAVAAAGLLCVLLLELGMFTFLYTTYAETMGLMGDVFLCDQPVIGGLFCLIDPEMTAAHLLAVLIAVFTLGVPIAIWSGVLEHDIHQDPQAWLAKPANRVIAVFAVSMLVLVFTLEIVNIYTLIARQSVGGPFQTTHTDPFIAFLAKNQALGLFAAFLTAVINAVLALLTVLAARSFKSALKGGL
ncbi:MAG: hypothetical protein AAGF94_16675 [Pseudomonadota bacterium]